MGKVLVTGANGFVGSHICEELSGSGFQVKALVRRTSDLTNIRDLDLELAYGDLTDPDSLQKAVAEVDAVVNNAGVTKALDVSLFDRVNFKGTENILKAVEATKPGIGRFVQISSTAACGPAPSDTPIDEDHQPAPVTAYGRSKLAGERAVLAFKERCPVTILRPTAVYGPRDKEMLSFFKTIDCHIKPTFGPGECYMNFTYVKDLARAAVRVLKADSPSGQVYFVAEGKSYSYSEAGDIISDVLGVRALDVHIPVSVMRAAGWISERLANLRNKPSIFTADKVNELTAKYWLVNPSKIERDLGFRSWTPFREGVEETVDWYREKGWL
jgi:nucleoside-diphosphate-sugar epimerase